MKKEIAGLRKNNSYPRNSINLKNNENDTPYKVKPAGRLTFSQVNPFNAFADARSFMTPLLQSRQYRDPARKKAFWNTVVQMMLPPSSETLLRLFVKI